MEFNNNSDFLKTKFLLDVGMPPGLYFTKLLGFYLVA